ncbi:hypothetical protein Btru_033220 [Bulinus truncatus]|nr:hypothetical protein Btru_033220 [Bulinus truncatus]
MLSSPSVTFYQNEDLKCNSPARLHGRPIRSIGDNEWASSDEIETDRLLGRTGPEPELSDESIKAAENQKQTEKKAPEQKNSGREKQSKKDKNVKQKGKDKSEKEKSKEKSEKEKTKEKSEKEKPKRSQRRKKPKTRQKREIKKTGQKREIIKNKTKQGDREGREAKQDKKTENYKLDHPISSISRISSWGISTLKEIAGIMASKFFQLLPSLKN